MFMRSLMICLMLLGTGAAAQTTPVLNVPVYSEATKSYFVLVEGRVHRSNGTTWEEAKHHAEKRSLAGVQGRLAVIPSPEVDMFVRLNLRPVTQTWFGLKYDCASRSLVWTDGRGLGQTGYSNWSPKGWLANEQFGICPAGHKLMPVYLNTTRDDRHWKVQHEPKRYYHYLVEYPTGRKLSSDEMSRELYDLQKIPTAIQVPSASAN